MNTKKDLTRSDYDRMHFGQVLPENYNRNVLFDFIALDEYQRQLAIYIELLGIKNLLNNCNNNSNSNTDYEKKIDELKNLCTPVVEYIQNNYDPHIAVVIQCDRADVVVAEMGCPYKMKD